MIYTFLADGFEEIEALCPVDIMRRAGLSVTTVGIGKKEIIGAHGICVIADVADTELSFEDIDLIFLPGGMPGTKNLDNSDTVHKAIDLAIQHDAYIAAICAAPMILGKRGLLNGKSAVCYPSFEEYLIGATIPNDTKLVTDGKIITAMGMGVSHDLGLEIVRIFCGNEKATALRQAIIAD
ncbi:MAG: DJ-1/PfpI family protein [Ruminococcaceae bacterium]|nr:DJ-1/PfpI family protein [Oscillospiraceae bacterium]